MALCTATELRYMIDSKTLTDTDYGNIIGLVSLEVVSRAGGSADVNSTDANLKLAGLHLAAAAVLRKMRVTGEMAASVKRGNSSQNNDPDSDIISHEAKAGFFIIRYRFETAGASTSVAYGRVGPGTVNDTSKYS